MPRFDRCLIDGRQRSFSVVSIYYINLASRPDRREFMEHQLAGLGLVGTRIESATPDDLTAEQLALYCNSEKPKYLRPRELACTMSHERAWAAMLANGDERALILEDDAELSSMLPRLLAELDGIDIDILRLEATGRRLRLLPKVQTTAGGVDLHPFRSTPMGAAGYIVNARAAKALLGHPAFRVLQTDLVLYNPFEAPAKSLSRLQTLPGMVCQLGQEHPVMRSVGKSDIAHVEERHAFKFKHPIQFRWMRFRDGLVDGYRNARDHFANRKNGLFRKAIPFAGADGQGR
nr:glycosyltransferase family 25 protein [Devosia sp. MC521]